MNRAEANGEAWWPVRTYDALTVPYWLLPSPHEWCDCLPECVHREECLTSPIYAELVEELGSPWGWCHDLFIAHFGHGLVVQMWWNKLGDNTNED